MVMCQKLLWMVIKVLVLITDAGDKNGCRLSGHGKEKSYYIVSFLGLFWIISIVPLYIYCYGRDIEFFFILFYLILPLALILVLTIRSEKTENTKDNTQYKNIENEAKR